MEFGLLSKGEVIFKTASDFVGGALGTSESLTRNILESAMGSVLVIDEAYGLNPVSRAGGISGGQDPYRTGVIDTIVEQVQGKPGEDRAVVLLGYRKEMEEMMSAANPGLSRRFDMENAFVFSDYDDEALLRILRKTCEKEGLKIDIDTAIYAVRQLDKAKSQSHFGNAGAVNNLLSIAKLHMQSRLSKLSITEREDRLIEQDFASNDLTKSNTDIFAGIVGCQNVVKKLKEYRDTIMLCKRLGKDPRELIEYNFLFVGSPGTGKVSVYISYLL